MRRSASEIINDLENRIAQLENKQAAGKQLIAILTVDGEKTKMRGMKAISKAITAYGLDTALYYDSSTKVRFTQDGVYGGPDLEVYGRDVLVEMGLRRLGGRNIKIKKI